MTPCRDIHESLGPYLDEELSPAHRRAIESHLVDCELCQTELSALRALAARFSPTSSPCAGLPPAGIWQSIESVLGYQTQPATIPVQARRPRLRAPIATAALIAVGTLVGIYGVGQTDPSGQAQAADMSFDLLLNDAPLDADRALQRFLVRHDGKRIAASRARGAAAGLLFELPEALPGGFILGDVYSFRFGDGPGIAAQYRRTSAGDSLIAIFHRPVSCHDYGTARDQPCAVGSHRGLPVRVGDWSMVHRTDATTCRCVLSRLDQVRELPPILDALTGEPLR